MMTLPEFTLLIDDKDINLFSLKLQSYETQSYTDRKSTGVNIPGAHGTQPVPSSLSSSNLVVSVVCVGNDAGEVRNYLRRFFAFMYSKQNAHDLVFTDDVNVVRRAILTSPDQYKTVEGIDGALAEIKLTFLMLDPFTYQRESDVFVTTAKHGEEILLENDAFECPAVFTLRNVGIAEISDVTLIVNDEITGFSCELKPGDEIVLDTVEYEVRYNGDARLDLWLGEMPMLKNGDNIIVQQNTQYADLLVSVEFTRLWI